MTPIISDYPFNFTTNAKNWLLILHVLCLEITMLATKLVKYQNTFPNFFILWFGYGYQWWIQDFLWGASTS